MNNDYYNVNPDHDYELQEVATPMSSDPQQSLPDWEDPGTNFIQGFFKTTIQCLFYPEKFFRKQKTQTQILPPLIYAMIMSLFASLVTWAYNILFLSDLTKLILNSIYPGNSFPTQEPGILLALGLNLLAPIFVVLEVSVTALLLHFLLWLFGGVKRSFSSTFRVACYSTSVKIFILIPILGMFIQLYQLFIQAIGLKETHETDTWRAVLAVITPSVFCCCAFSIIIGLGALFIGTIIANGSF